MRRRTQSATEPREPMPYVWSYGARSQRQESSACSAIRPPDPIAPDFPNLVVVIALISSSPQK